MPAISPSVLSVSTSLLSVGIYAHARVARRSRVGFGLTLGTKVIDCVTIAAPQAQSISHGHLVSEITQSKCVETHVMFPHELLS